MKAQLGKQTGIALALLATLLATLFAMGAFPVAQAQDATHSATRSISPNPVIAGGTVTVTITLSDYPLGGVVEEAYPSGYTLADKGDFTPRGDGLAYIIFSGGTSSTVSYTLTAPMTPGESPAFSGTFVSNKVPVDIGGDSTVTVSAGSDNAYLSSLSLGADVTLTPEFKKDNMDYTASVDYDVASVTVTATPEDANATVEVTGGDSLMVGENTITVMVMAENGINSMTYTVTVTREPAPPMVEVKSAAGAHVPGANVRIELSGLIAEKEIAAGDDFTISLGGFSLPSSISNTAVLIDNAGGYSGSPSEVVVGSNGVVEISLYSRWPGGAPAKAIQGAYSVTFKQSAGISNPAAADDIKITVTDEDGAEDAVTHTVQRVTSLSAGSGPRGTMTTATFKGFDNGSATVNLNGEKLAEVMIAGNTGTYEIDTSSAKFMRGDAGNTITVVDSSGMSAESGVTFTILPKVVASPKRSLWPRSWNSSCPTGLTAPALPTSRLATTLTYRTQCLLGAVAPPRSPSRRCLPASTAALRASR